MPPALCGELLEQTYGALQGWTPSKKQLQRMCVGLLVVKMRVARTAKTAAGPCRAFTASPAARHVLSTSRSEAPLAPLPQLKEQWCHARPSQPPGRLGHKQHRAPSARLLRPRSQADNNQGVVLGVSWPPKQAVVKKPGADTKPDKVAGRAAALRGAHGRRLHLHHHEVVKPPRLDPDTVWRVREELLAAADSQANAGGASYKGPALVVWVPGSSKGASSDSLNTIASDTNNAEHQSKPSAVALITSNATKSRMLVETDDGDGDTVENVPPAAPSRRAGPSALGFARSGLTWLTGHALAAMDFICDGRFGIQSEKTHLSVAD